jgi:hypothetical protein
MTFEQLQEIVTRTSITVAELTESQKETRASIAELTENQEETRASIAELTESQKKSDESHKEIRALIKEVAEAHKKTELAQQKTELALQKLQHTLGQTLEELSGNVGYVNRRLGDVVEMIVLPGLMKKMNQLGHNFTMSSPQKKFSKDGKQFAEIDLMLENGDEVMAVEAKARFKLGEMNDFLRRIELLRKNEKITGVAGKTIYVAVAAIGFDKPARKLAEEKGMHIIEINQDNNNIKIKTPPKGKIGKW